MEALLLLGGLALTGFQLNKDKTEEERQATASTKVPVANEIPNSKEMTVDARVDEQEKAKVLFPLRYDLAFGSDITGPLEPLSNDLTHSNMTPSYSGMQNKYLVNDLTFDAHTGGKFYETPKRELYMTELQEVQDPVNRTLDVSDVTRQAVGLSVRDDLNYFQLEKEQAIDVPRITRGDIDSTALSKLRMDPSKEKRVPKGTYEVPFVPGKAAISMPSVSSGVITTDRPATSFVGRELSGNRSAHTAPVAHEEVILTDTKRGIQEPLYLGTGGGSSMPFQALLSNGYESNRLNYGELERTATRQDYSAGANTDITEYTIKEPKRVSYSENTMEGTRRVISSLIQSYAPAPSETRKEMTMGEGRFGPSVGRVKKDMLSQTKILIRETVKQYVEKNNYLAPATIKGTNQRADDNALHTREVRTITVGEHIPNGGREIGVAEMAATTRPVDRTYDARMNPGVTGGSFEPSTLGEETRGAFDTSIPDNRMPLSVEARNKAQAENPFILDVANGL